MFRITGNISYTTGTYGGEVRLGGSKVGWTAKVAESPILDVSVTLDDKNGVTGEASTIHDSTKETFGASAGAVYGSGFETTIDTESGEQVTTSTLNFGYAKVSNQTTTDASGNKKNEQWGGVEIGATYGYFLGLDVNLAIEINLGWKPSVLGPTTSDTDTSVPRDNTTVIVPTKDLDEIIFEEN